MEHADLVGLIEKGITKNNGGVWADFGSGEGAFTLALRDIAGPNVKIISIDKDTYSLAKQKASFDTLFPKTQIEYVEKDFLDVLDLPTLDGLIAANSIHFQRETTAAIAQLSQYLKPNGTFIVVEYNVDHGNAWVPHPFSYKSFEKCSTAAGLILPELLKTIPSGVLNEMYAAKAVKK